MWVFDKVWSVAAYFSRRMMSSEMRRTLPLPDPTPTACTHMLQTACVLSDLLVLKVLHLIRMNSSHMPSFRTAEDVHVTHVLHA